jgi:hypothetical protein
VCTKHILEHKVHLHKQDSQTLIKLTDAGSVANREAEGDAAGFARAELLPAASVQIIREEVT